MDMIHFKLKKKTNEQHSRLLLASLLPLGNPLVLAAPKKKGEKSAFHNTLSEVAVNLRDCEVGFVLPDGHACERLELGRSC